MILPLTSLLGWNQQLNSIEIAESSGSFII
uniref:Uncharacterized protein n=1 Tax=Utricularia reniformis TaxID=192314 RepID=A0A1Y0B1P9_9LAMI|nr:hypothetical protein AEK19_MT1083 [Utricularia reniformis]ART31304.1 hypothetical protein AEK19_MT1083 [Utricularia reniformis]